MQTFCITNHGKHALGFFPVYACMRTRARVRVRVLVYESVSARGHALDVLDVVVLPACTRFFNLSFFFSITI